MKESLYEALVTPCSGKPDLCHSTVAAHHSPDEATPRSSDLQSVTSSLLLCLQDIRRSRALPPSSHAAPCDGQTILFQRWNSLSASSPCPGTMPPFLSPHCLCWSQSHLLGARRKGGFTPGTSCASLAHKSLKESRQSLTVTAQQQLPCLSLSSDTTRQGHQGHPAWSQPRATLLQDSSQH